MTLFLILCVVVVISVRVLQLMFDEGERYEGLTAPPIVSTYLIESVGGLGRLAIIAVLVLPIQFVRLVIDFQAQTSGLTASQLNQSILTILGSQILAKSIDTAIFAFLIAFTPMIFSLLTLFVAEVGAGRSESRKFGARKPTPALGEFPKIQQAKEELRTAARARGIRMSEPVDILVIDTLFINSYTVGRVIYLTTGLLKTQFVKPVLAHELGHLMNKDGRMLLALRRLIVPLAYWIGIDRSPKPIGLIAGGTVQKVDMGDDAQLFYKVKTLSMRFQMAFFLGGLGLLLRAREWANYWQSRDRNADGYAVSLGEGMSLQHFLREYQELDIPQPYLLSGRPYTAERIEHISWLLEQTKDPQKLKAVLGHHMVTTAPQPTVTPLPEQKQVQQPIASQPPAQAEAVRKEDVTPRLDSKEIQRKIREKLLAFQAQQEGVTPDDEQASTGDNQPGTDPDTNPTPKRRKPRM